MRVRKFQQYDETFREEALALLERSNRTLSAVAQDLGSPTATLRYWYTMAKKRKVPKAARPTTAPPKSESAQEKLERLERENERLRKKVDELEMDRAILKKAAAFFVKESE
jgi:transposase